MSKPHDELLAEQLQSRIMVAAAYVYIDGLGKSEVDRILVKTALDLSKRISSHEPLMTPQEVATANRNGTTTMFGLRE